ncbi:transcription termination/antitermination protein NusG [Treponema sp.]|uniref:transcription termination/antitermination protein NusG n=1 Tax=Treponema sp. TaxID=166 RepID=UPI0025D3B988|nr:transcription termination/antitermination protein NusG [Treponema sp.]MBQ8678379.1 transcription termination/antitermination factor NusG [Treponema sp.]
MAKGWYIVHTYTGYENKIERTLRMKIEEGELDSAVVSDVKVPVEELIEIKDGKRRSRKNKFLPGYIMLEMDLPDIGWKSVCSTIRSVQGVTGFVGTNPNQRPRPISNDEARNILMKSGDIKGEKSQRIVQAYSVGDQVKINEGPFASFSGAVEEVYADKSKLRVMVQIFGRATPVEVDITQVEKLIQ